MKPTHEKKKFEPTKVAQIVRKSLVSVELSMMGAYSLRKKNHQFFTENKKLPISNVLSLLYFSFLSLCVNIFKDSPSQFLSHWELAEQVFCSEELSFLPYKNQNKSLTLSSLSGKIKICLMVRIYTKSFFHQPTFMVMY